MPRTDDACPACGHLLSYHDQPGEPGCIGSTTHRGATTSRDGRCGCDPTGETPTAPTTTPNPRKET